MRITSTIRTLACAIAVGLAGPSARTSAQSPPAPDTDARFSASIGYEVHRDRMHYGFENPSNIDTPFLVPHRFDQTYVADNQWLVASMRYRIFGDIMQTDVGVTPIRATTASDLDTFYDPDDDVVVSGTSGDVSMHSFRVAQWSEARFWGLPWRAGYVYRGDFTEFHSIERLLTHSRPPSESRTPINTHETTISRVQEIALGVSKPFATAGGWQLTAGADLAPIASATLTTRLPEKYPGVDIDFRAYVGTLSAHAEARGRIAGWPVTVRVAYGRTWSYRESEQLDRRTFQAGIRAAVRK